MLGETDSIEETLADDLKGKKKKADAMASHRRWLETATAIDQGSDKDRSIIATALSHLEASRKIPMPIGREENSLDSRWSKWADKYYEDAKTFTSCREVLHFAQRQIPFDHREKADGGINEKYEKIIEHEFPKFWGLQSSLSDNSKSIPETLFPSYDRLVSNIFYWHMRVMFRCQKDIRPLESIIEIGGGYGGLARLWMLNKSIKIKRYVIADLPESLFYSEVCLRDEFGDDVGYWDGTDPGTRIVLLPVNRLDEYKRLSDLVINVGSMQEMNDHWVTFYMRWLDIYQPRFFYSLNYMGQDISYLWESRTFWAPRPSNQWATRSVNADIPLVKVMCAGRDFAEVIYERAEPQQRFSDWSVLKGGFFNRATYLEGLELLRQDPKVENAEKFIAIVCANHNSNRFPCPKEIMFLASVTENINHDPVLKNLIKVLSDVKKIGSY